MPQFSFTAKRVNSPSTQERPSVAGVFGIAGLLLLSNGLSGCASPHHRDAADAGLGPTAMLFSPNGEPLNGGSLGRPTCEAALERWLVRLDANRDGRISHYAYMADASAQFLRMDIDGNGYLLSAELERYRLPYRHGAAPRTPAALPSDAGGTDGQQTRHRRGHHGSSDGGDGRSGPGAVSSSDLDPVMSADLNPSSPPIGAPHANLTILAANFRGSAPSRSPTPIVVP